MLAFTLIHVAIGDLPGTGMDTIAATTTATVMATTVVPLPVTGQGTTRAKEIRQATMFTKTGRMVLHAPVGKHTTPKPASNYPGTPGRIILPGKLPKKQTGPIMFTPIKAGMFIKRMATTGKNKKTENGKMPQPLTGQRQTDRTTKAGMPVNKRNRILIEVRIKPADSNSPIKI